MSREPRPGDADEASRSVPGDRIYLNDYVIDVEIGAFQQERGVTQRVRFGLVATLTHGSPPTSSDDVDDILSYDVLIDAIHDELAVRRHNLLETLAEGIAARALSHRRVAEIAVRIEKLDRVSGVLGIDIRRSRARTEPPSVAGPRFNIVLLGRSALKDPGLGETLSEAFGDTGAVLCLDAPLPEPCVPEAPAAQRRIDLLAMGQAAWRFTADHPDTVVVETRTELDWGMRHGRIAIWAPSKMVIDAPDGSPARARDMPSLALWLAGQLGATEILVLGDAALPTGALPVAIKHVS